MNNNRDLLFRVIIILGIIIIIYGTGILFYAGSHMSANHTENNSGLINSEIPESINSAGSAYNIETEDPGDVSEPVPATPLPGPSPVSTEIPQAMIMQQFYFAPLTDAQKEFITGYSYPDTSDDLQITYEDLSYVHILHYDFEGNSVEGELICNKAIAQDLTEIFYELYLNEYPLERVALIEHYNGNDDLSMEDNNTSCFNYRVVSGTSSLSLHAYGLAVDINPFYNPYITYNKDGSMNIAPEGSDAYADRTADHPYMIDENDLCCKLFKEHGFTWGGDWSSSKDYQHFQKKVQ